MVNNAKNFSQQQGIVNCPISENQPEMQIGQVASQMAWRRSGHVGLGLELVGYTSQWRNDLYDKYNRITIRLQVLRVEGCYADFTYSGWRVAGPRIGDGLASVDQEPEWFEIRVLRSPVTPKGRGVVTATWKRIAQPK